jgi:L-alanine-DL-glutamate epimerase-like enolase superfamily enzyme
MRRRAQLHVPEYIPQLHAITRTELLVADACARRPTVPGLGIDGDRDAMDDMTVA